jgi:hypothetical protein
MDQREFDAKKILKNGNAPIGVLVTQRLIWQIKVSQIFGGKIKSKRYPSSKKCEPQIPYDELVFRC